MKITLNPETHIYKIDNLNCVGVNELIESFGIGNYGKIPKHILEPAADFGKKGHLIAKYHFQQRLNEETVDPKLFPYLVGLKKLCIEHKIEPLAIEETIGYKPLLVCGTPDFRGRFDDWECFIEWKFVKKVQKPTHLQLGGYRYIHNANIKEPEEELGRGFIIQLVPNDYNIVEEDLDSENEFENLLLAHHIQRKYRR